MNHAPTSDLHDDKKKILLGGISFILSSATLATQYNPEKHHRRSIRLTGYDYKQSGAYFVTIVTVIGSACSVTFRMERWF